jgi:ribonuclease HI
MPVNKVQIFTDGACRGNPGKGGWGAVLYQHTTSGTKSKQLCGGEKDTTNNRMELLAAIKALEALKKNCSVVLTTDSQYVRLGVTQWMAKWKKNNWHTSNKKPVKNLDLWQRLEQAALEHDIDWQWVKGHSGDAGNELADKLANQGIDKLT